MISGPEIEWKFAFVSDATALARSVLPVPGGPCKRTPFGASTPSRSNNSGCRRGSSIISRTLRTSLPRPPMSSQSTFGTFASSSFIGFSAILISVSASTRTASAPGENDVTTKSNLRPMTLTLITSPRVIARPCRTCAMFCSPPMIRMGSVGASDTFSAGRASAFRNPTLSSIPTPALRRCIPSIRITPRFASSGYPRRTPAAVDFEPSMRTMSPSFNSRIFMTSGSIRTIPPPASAGFASATRRNFSRPAAIFSVPPFARPHARPSRDFARNRRYLNSCGKPRSEKEKENRSRAESLDRHLDGFRPRGRRHLRDPDLEDAQLGVASAGEGTSPEALLEAPAEGIEPSVHVVQPGEGRYGRPRQARLSVFCLNLLALSLHGAPPPRGFCAVNNVYAVLYEYYDSECEFRKGAGGPGCTDSVQRVYVSRFTVIGIAPLLNSTHAISIGSTTPLGTSMRIADPMLIWRPRAPIMRAFSNRV